VILAFNLSHIKFITQSRLKLTISMPTDKMTTPKIEDAVFLAKLAEQAERYEGTLNVACV
jgi:hypothetical protein